MPSGSCRTFAESASSKSDRRSAANPTYCPSGPCTAAGAAGRVGAVASGPRRKTGAALVARAPCRRRFEESIDRREEAPSSSGLPPPTHCRSTTSSWSASTCSTPTCRYPRAAPAAGDRRPYGRRPPAPVHPLRVRVRSDRRRSPRRFARGAANADPHGARPPPPGGRGSRDRRRARRSLSRLGRDAELDEAAQRLPSDPRVRIVANARSSSTRSATRVRHRPSRRRPHAARCGSDRRGALPSGRAVFRRRVLEEVAPRPGARGDRRSRAAARTRTRSSARCRIESAEFLPRTRRSRPLRRRARLRAPCACPARAARSAAVCRPRPPKAGTPSRCRRSIGASNCSQRSGRWTPTATNSGPTSTLSTSSNVAKTRATCGRRRRRRTRTTGSPCAPDRSRTGSCGGWRRLGHDGTVERRRERRRTRDGNDLAPSVREPRPVAEHVVPPAVARPGDAGERSSSAALHGWSEKKRLNSCFSGASWSRSTRPSASR